jgi:hypothetical protein
MALVSPSAGVNVTSLSILIFICLLAAILPSVVDIRVRGKRDVEMYLSDDVMTKLKSDKSNAYNESGIRFFYSDGSSFPKNSVYFRPSDGDIVCNFSRDSVKKVANCPSEFKLEDVTVIDMRTQFTDPRYECSTMMSPNVSRDLRNNMDARVRVLLGEYEFAKTCLTLETLVLDASIPTYTVLLDRRAFSTKLFFLLRPIFVRGPGCAPMRTRTISMYDSHDPNSVSQTNIPVVFEEVSDTRILGGNPGDFVDIGAVLRNMRTTAVKYGSKRVNIPMVMYYLNFVQDVPVESLKYTNVVTAFITRTTLNAQVRLTDSVVLTVNVGSVDVNISNASRPFEVDRVRDSSLVVVTFTTSLIIMASMDSVSGRVQVLQIGGIPVMRMSTEALTRVERLFPPMNNMYPYTNKSIPNLADLALRLNAVTP